MNDGSTNRFALLLELAEKIAENHKPKFMVILRTHDKKWMIAINSLNDKEDYPVPTSGGFETMEKALEEFVVNPQKFLSPFKG